MLALPALTPPLALQVSSHARVFVIGVVAHSTLTIVRRRQHMCASVVCRVSCVPSVILRTVFVPLFVFCAKHTVLPSSDVLVYVIMLLFAISNGYAHLRAIDVTK
jgi:hypothetical protein